jgi:hypothetical protein
MSLQHWRKADSSFLSRWYVRALFTSLSVTVSVGIFCNIASTVEENARPVRYANRSGVRCVAVWNRDATSEWRINDQSA